MSEASRSLAPQQELALLVRVLASEFLGRIRAADPVPVMLGVLKESESHVTTLLALNAVVYLRDTLGYAFNLSQQDVTATGGQVSRRIDYLMK